MDTDVCTKLNRVRQRIQEAESRYRRPTGSVRLLAVSKGHPPERIRQAAVCGQRVFGESYLQEALPKLESLDRLGLEWHFIGPLQTNKTRPVAERFDWVHSVDRLKIARRLNDQRPPDLPPLNMLLQVNISGEAGKSGTAADELRELVTAIRAFPNLRLRGLMAIPARSSELESQRVPFAALAARFNRLRDLGVPLDTLSMGMSGDLEAAIAEGATVVRIGTAIFGPRPAPVKRAL